MKILLVEDDQAIIAGLEYSLTQEGYELVICPNKQKALQALTETTFDLLLLDVTLPDGTGYEICQEIKKKQDTPVIFLTACDDEVNVVMGLDMGADDYITKPFRIRELLSRIKSVLRRYMKEEQQDGVHVIGDLEIQTKQARVLKAGLEIPLTALEYRLLLVFSNHLNQILTRDQLLEGIWDVGGNFVNDNTLTVYIKRLREKLDTPGEAPYIQTVRGIGYRMEEKNAQK
ncbi:response regulator transcription factor [Isobaculum melis]|uniref:DNA-binding response regulator, OmpR family, contains REC and winged-helix (WHTH) domain n=1 Tax=Isobaculum melis TaxID=142588 RepID=A0A1H9PZ99_9LACT|nr:response regulator transcription factor [Isobaculum melis]SER53547.1 DNA-binding response regulator, OmpR family, contains REC and winged-helix (wHTH) domain [Isobaculum melis]